MRAVACLALTGSLLFASAGHSQDDKRLEKRLQAIRDRHEIPGLVLLIVDKTGIRESLALGYANLAEKRPMTIDTLVRIGSITKTFNAIALLQLAAAKLSADEQTLRRLAVGYDTDGRSVIPYWHMVIPPMGAINATPREMARLPQFFLRRGDLDKHRILAPARAYLGEGTGPSGDAALAAGISVPAPVAGDYEQLTSRFDSDRRLRLSVVKRNDTFYLVYPGGREIPLVAVAEGLFRHPNEPIATMAIVQVNGRPVILGDFGNFGKR